MKPATVSKILIVDDDQAYREMLVTVLSTLTTEIQIAFDGTSAINIVNKTMFDVVLLDMELPRVSGMEVLSHITAQAASTPVIILTGSKDVRLAVEAMKRGAYDYLTKPCMPEELLVAVDRAVEYRVLKNKASIVERSKAFSNPDDSIIGGSPEWLAILDQAKLFAENDSLILLLGETGSGKDVLANFIHRHSSRRDRPFLVVDCGVIPNSLIESEIFGHEKGAFTGADQTKEGLVELAQGGTLFLDEIGHVDLTFQQKILKFVETKTFRRVGDTETRAVDVRIIAATNKNLPEEIKADRFRNDLWYRLNAMKIEIPPLRERPADIPLLVEYFLQKYSLKRPGLSISPEATQVLERYPWPGNVRELQSTIQRALTVSQTDRIEIRDLGIDLRNAQTSGTLYRANGSLLSLKGAEKLHVLAVLGELDWNISKAAKVLQIGRTTLHAKMKEYSLQAPTGP